MKHLKRLASLLLALTLVFALAATASAATVTVPTTGILKDHTFTAYQVFSGREENNVLSDVQWGDGINSTAFLGALKADTTYGSLFTNCSEAQDVAVVLSTNNNNGALANAVAKLAYANKAGTGTALTSGTNDLADGYYLVVDTTENVGEGGAYNTALLQVVGDINITVKTDAPTVEKKVLEDDKYNQDGGYGTGYNDVADYNIGDAVPFHLIGSVPDMSRYDTYKYIFHDTLSDGLTAPTQTDVKVYLSGNKIRDESDTDVTSSFTVAVEGQNITVSINNLKSINNIAQGQYVIVEYSAVLNQSAKVGLPGNPNTVYLQYSNKPDQSGSGDTDNTGNTPEDKVIIFTYELDTTKVDGKDNTKKLKDAKFVLLNSDASKVAKITNGKFDGWQDLPTAGTDGKIAADAWTADTVLTSAETTGLFSVTGLDAGTYKLREIVAPAGYNLLSQDIVVVITATTANGQNWTDGDVSKALTNLAVTADSKAGTGDTSSGIAGITIANNAGSTLPETGGMGTTLFYVLGSILAFGAIVLLVTKKRMNSVE